MSIWERFKDFAQNILDVISRLNDLQQQKPTEDEIKADIGKKGEVDVANILKKLGSRYKVYNDLYVPKNQYAYSQIDHLVISNDCIVVIETKTYSGVLEGKEKDEYWLHTNSSGKSYNVYNPVRQNEGHIRAVSKYLGVDESSIVSFIVFNGSVDYSKIKSNKLVRVDDIVSKIKGLPPKNGIAYDKSKVKLDNTKATKYIRDRHLNQVKEMSNSYGECPVCKNRLVKRYGTYGEFIGCNGYPKCNYIKKEN